MVLMDIVIELPLLELLIELLPVETLLVELLHIGLVLLVELLLDLHVHSASLRRLSRRQREYRNEELISQVL